MITKKELKGVTIKKAIKAHRVAMRWHNKNKSGGNFGFNIYFGPEFNRGTDTELTGYYNKDGFITRLNYGFLYQAGHTIPKEFLSSLDALFKHINSVKKRYTLEVEGQHAVTF